jgi:tRNA pseudouridine55 synthase
MIVSINKPKGVTSFDVVLEVKKIARQKRVGHAGTLDPLASGVLIIGWGRDTRKLGKITGQEKEYEVEITLGARSSTDDKEGGIEPVAGAHSPNREDIEYALESFVGTIQQIPPQFSAVKVDGERAYKLAREGQYVDLKPRRIKIFDIQIMEYAYPLLKLKVECGKGTYIRSLARDIGEVLKTGGYVSELIRTRVGEYTLERSYTLKEFKENYNRLKK